MKVAAFAGYSGSGKTHLIEQLIPALKLRGLRVSVVKHAHHKFDIDHEGKDTFRHREAGAFEVVVASSKRLALMREFEREAHLSVHHLIAELHDGVDWVLVEGAAPNALRIVALLPRFSAIKRGAAGEHYRQQVIAANIDTAFVVSGLDADFNPRRIERYLLLVAGSGVEPVVVLTKPDKDGADVDAALQDLRALDVAVLAVNAKDRGSVAALAPWLGEGRSIVLVGSSGAGKSTLTNTLLGVEKMKTGEVRESDARGRHTTTHRALIALPSGACIIDTPGMRELKPTGEEDVAESFVDVEALAAQCRFRDCRHAREPGCAVRAAVEAGDVDGQRVANFLKLSSEVAGAATQLATRLAQKAEARGPGKAASKRAGDRYGQD